jgi:hypothetical protein
MNPEHLGKIEALYHAALSLAPTDRERLLADADPEMRAEVESLLAQASGTGILGRPAIDAAESLFKSGAALPGEPPGKRAHRPSVMSSDSTGSSRSLVKAVWASFTKPSRATHGGWSL